MTSTNTMNGRTILITGGTGGIGMETARGLVRMGAHIVMVGRDAARGQQALDDLRREPGGGSVALLLADLSSQAAIRHLSNDITRAYPKIDVLINNVGGLYPEPWRTADGIDATLAMNHFNPFLLTRLLQPAVQAAAPARVIFVTGGMPNTFDMAYVRGEKAIPWFAAYSQSKAVMMSAAYELAQQWAGSGVTVNVAYPGAADTAMTRGMQMNGDAPFFMRLLGPVFRVMMSNARPERAARSSIYLASSPEVEGVTGTFFSTNSKPTRWPKVVLDDALRAQVWSLTEAALSLNDAQQHPAPLVTPRSA